MSVVPAMLAERLGLPQVTFASELTVEGGTVTIRRDGDAASETIAATLPALVSVTDQINEPRYPSFKGIMAAKKKPVEQWSLADLGVDADAGRPRRRLDQGRVVHPAPPARAGPDRHRRGRRRHQARRVPRRAEVRLSRPSQRREPTMAEVLVLVDHVDGTVRKTTARAADHRPPPRRAVRRLHRRRVRRRQGDARAVRRGEGLPRRVRRGRPTTSSSPRPRCSPSSSPTRRRPRCSISSTPRARRSPPASAIKTESGLITDAVDVQAGAGGGVDDDAVRLRRLLHRDGDRHQGHADHRRQAQLRRARGGRRCGRRRGRRLDPVRGRQGRRR